LLGHYIAEFAGMILAITLLLTAGLIIGWRTHSSALEIVEAFALLLLVASAMIWLGTWIGMLVRTPDAVMGIAFVIIFPLTFISNAFVPIETMPNALQWFASINPVSVMVSAVRELFGNPTAPVTKDVWTLTHPVISAWIMTIGMLAIFIPLAVHRYRVRTTD
jgi:ABC-2 type transport system permease protein